MVRLATLIIIDNTLLSIDRNLAKLDELVEQAKVLKQNHKLELATLGETNLLRSKLPAREKQFGMSLKERQLAETLFGRCLQRISLPITKPDYAKVRSMLRDTNPNVENQATTVKRFIEFCKAQKNPLIEERLRYRNDRSTIITNISLHAC